MELDPWISKAPFPIVPSSVAVALIGPESESVFRVSTPCWGSPVQQKASSASVPRCSPSPHVGSTGPHGHGGITGECKEEGTRGPTEPKAKNQEPKERIPLLRGLCILKFSLARSGHTYSGQWPLLLGVTDRKHLPSSSQLYWASLCPVLFPWSFAGNMIIMSAFPLLHSCY